jgi:hypothetical protein
MPTTRYANGGRRHSHTPTAKAVGVSHDSCSDKVKIKMYSYFNACMII